MYPAAEAGEVDVIAAYTSDGRIARHGLVVLDDPKQAIPPYDAIMLVSPKRANDGTMLDALRPLTGAIDVTLMREANLRATAADASPASAARWLWAEIEQPREREKIERARHRRTRDYPCTNRRQLTSSSTVRSDRWR